MKHLGFFLQLTVLCLLPLLILWQLLFSIPLIVMPASLTVGVILFTLGQKLREPG